MTTVLGIPVSVSPFLVGQDRPVMSDGKLIVSPAMMSLIDGATDAELEHLLLNMNPIRIDGLFNKEATVPEMMLPLPPTEDRGWAAAKIRYRYRGFGA